MNSIEEYQDSIKSLASNTQRKYTELCKAHKDIEKELVDMYHCIEEIRFDHVSRSHFYMKKLQDILTRRRTIKESQHQLHAALEHLQRSASAVDTAAKSSKKRLDNYKALSDVNIEKLNIEYNNR